MAAVELDFSQQPADVALLQNRHVVALLVQQIADSTPGNAAANNGDVRHYGTFTIHLLISMYGLFRTGVRQPVDPQPFGLAGRCFRDRVPFELPLDEPFVRQFAVYSIEVVLGALLTRPLYEFAHSVPEVDLRFVP